MKKATQKAILTAVLVLPMHSMAEVILKEGFYHYPVSGSNKKQLAMSAKLRSPAKPFFAKTDMKIGFQGNYKSGRGYCYLDNVKITANITYVMPKLEKSNYAMQSFFNNWYQRILFHEKNHGKIAKEAAYKINNELSQLKRERSCEQLKLKVNNIFTRYNQEKKIKNAAYDKRTKHGKTEGAWLTY